MLLSSLDLEKIQVDEIMVPRGEIIGLDLTDEVDELVSQLRSSQHTRLPVFNEDIEGLLGVLHARTALKLLDDTELSETSMSLKIVSSNYAGRPFYPRSAAFNSSSTSRKNGND